MKCGRHCIRAGLSTILALALGTGWMGWTGGAARADDAGSGHAVALCCAWGNKLGDGVLTYTVSGTDPGAASIIRQAFAAWDDALPDLTFTEAAGKAVAKADITVSYGSGAAEGGEGPSGTGASGLTTTYMNTRRMIQKVRIGIDGGPAPVNAGAVEQIAKHEVGHALGLGHANWDGDLMSPLVNPVSAPIPACDINAVVQANSWRMADHGKRPKPAPASQAPC